MQYLKIYFSFASAVFRWLSNDIALKGLFLHNCVVFSLFCVAIVIFEPVFERAYFGTDFVTVCQITLCPTFSGTFHRFFFFSFFFLIESEISEQASRQIAREEPNRFVNMPRAVIDVIITWAETKILKEKTKWTVRVSKVSHSVRLQAYLQ